MKFSRSVPSRREQPEAAPERPTAWDRLVKAGIVDRAFCEAQTGRRFDSDLAAARHCARTGSYSPHPLLDLASLPPWVRAHLADGKVASLLKYLRANGASRPLGPCFDSAAVAGTAAEKAAHPGGALGLFLEVAVDDTPLPGHPDLTLGSLRTALVEHARLVVQQMSLTGPRTSNQWDQAAEDAWRARWLDAPLPAGSGPLVSVVMPVRNRADLVPAALASLIDQTLEDWELLVVDDGSTDDTVRVLETWAARDDRIRVIRQDWTGVSAARNRGLEHARGRYVAFLDSDNRWRPDFLRLAVAAMHGQGLTAAYAGMVLNDPQHPGHPVYRARAGSLEDLLVVNHVDLNVLVADLELAREVGGFDEGLRRWVDHDFALRLARRVELQLLPFLAVDYDNSAALADRITTSESEAWQFVVLGKHWVDWEAIQQQVTDRVPGRVSVVIPTWNDVRMTSRAVAALLAHTPDIDLEVVVLDNGSRVEFGLSLVAAFAGDGRIHYERLPRNLNFAIGCNVAFARTTGETVVFLNNDTEPRPGWLPPLLEHLADESVLGVQPLLLYPNDSIQTAGTVFPVDNGLPCHYLVGHPPEDALKIQDLDFHAVTAAALVMRATDVAELRGFDPIFVNGNEDIDLCLRAAQHRGGRFRLEPRSRVTHHEGQTTGRSQQITENRRHFLDRWRGRLPAGERQRWVEAGFAVAHLAGEDVEFPRPKPLIIRPLPTVAPGEVPSLRWGVKLAANGGERGDKWGDTHFAESLATSLRSLGQDAVTYRHDAHHVVPSRLDDVVLGIRGLDVVHPIPGKVNVLWVISHPDDVTPEELLDFDLVLAASGTWAEEMTHRSGRPVEVLLQATDLRLRADLARPVGSGECPVFVGITNPQRPRQIVLDAVAAGVPVAVHGPNWLGTIPEQFVKSAYVPNDRLMTVYRDHGLVLADHWGDMATHGFLANRLFDAVASGARVICDDVPGLEEFGGAVQAYHSLDELAFLCSPEGRSRFPDDREMAAIADRVAERHSFDRRAGQLLAAAHRIWETKRG